MPPYRPLLLALLLAVPAARGGAIYRWTDAAGVTHYSDQRPAGRQYVQVQLPREAPAAAADGQRPARALCREAVRALNVLRRPGPVYRDADGHWRRHDSAFSRQYRGERRYLDEDRRPAVLRRARAAVDTYCGAMLPGGRAVPQGGGKRDALHRTPGRPPGNS